MDITKENLLKIKISELDISEWLQEDILEYIEYLKDIFSEYFSSIPTNIGIYKLTSPSSKYYIGQSVNIKNRHRAYKGLHCKDQPILFRALNKYGWEYFDVDILDNIIDTSNESLQIINLLEFLYIRYYKQFSNCYNISYGGDSLGKHHEKTIEKLKLSKKCIKIDKYDLKGQFLETYSSISEACRDNNIKSRSNIQKCLRGGQNSCYNFIFVKHGNSLVLEDRINKHLMAVDQYSKSGNFIKTWDSVKEASISLNINKSGISDCLYGRKKSCGNYYWVRSGFDFDITKYKKQTGKTNTKQIIQLSIEGVFIKEWPSVKEASKTLKINRTGISNCLSGKTKSSAKFKWIYK